MMPRLGKSWESKVWHPKTSFPEGHDILDAPVATEMKPKDRVHDNHEKWVVSLTISSLKRSSKYMLLVGW